MSDLLNAKELAAELGIGHASFHKRRTEWARLFEVKRPIGHRRYSRALLERYLAGQPMAGLGAGSRKART